MNRRKKVPVYNGKIDRESCEAGVLDNYSRSDVSSYKWSNKGSMWIEEFVKNFLQIYSPTKHLLEHGVLPAQSILFELIYWEEVRSSLHVVIMPFIYQSEFGILFVWHWWWINQAWHYIVLWWKFGRGGRRFLTHADQGRIAIRKDDPRKRSVTSGCVDHNILFGGANCFCVPIWARP